MNLKLKTDVLVEPVLVGRERELEELQSRLNAAVEGKGVTIFVSGEAGSGKTRLIREFLKAAKKKGIGVMAGWCLSDAAAPYFPFVEAFHSYFTASDEEEQPTSPHQLGKTLEIARPAQMIGEERGMAAWLTGPTPLKKPGRNEAVSPQVWKDQVYAGVAGTLHSIAAQAPIILFLEDIHWADSASLALLHYIARAVDNAEKILVLATFRSEELTADAEGHPHPLAETLRAMRREDLFSEIKLQSLSETNVAEIAKNMIGGTLHPQLAEKLAAESKGNPLFVVESLRMLNERKSLVQENNEWHLAIDELGIPSKIKDIILRRLAALKYAQRRVLDAASVIGEKFDVELLSTVLGQDVLEVLETLNIIAHSTSLIVVEGNLYRFDHARSRETLYEELSPPLKKGYHSRIAEKLEDTSKNGKLPYSDLAYHYAQAGNSGKASKYALDAGQDALNRFSNTEAIKHFAYVLQTTPQEAETRRIALEGLGDAYYASSMFKEATRIFEDLATTVVTDVVRLRAFRKAMEAVFQYMDMPHLMELVKKAEPYAAADRLESARVLLSRARVYTFGQNRWKLAIEDQAAALRVFEEEYSLWDAAFALFGAGATHAVLGEGSQKGIAESLRSIALFEELGDFRFQMEAYYTAGITFGNCLLYNEGTHARLGMYAKVIEIDEKKKMGNYQRLVYANAFSAWVYESMGNWEEALSHSLKALELSKKTDNLIAPAIAYSNLSIEYVRLGDLKYAEEYFEKLMKLPPEVLLNPFVQGVFAKAIFFAGKGQWKEANLCFKEIFEGLKAFPSPGFELSAKLGFAWALERQGRFEEAKSQLEECQRIRQEAEARFEHADLQAYLMTRRQVEAGEEFEMRLDMVNVGRKPALLVKIENLLLEDFKVAALPSWCSLENGSIDMKDREIGAFQIETVKLKVKASKPGAFTFNPQVSYIDELGETKTCKPNPITITVQPAQPKYEVLPGRVSTGSEELDALLFGGIPQNCAVALTAPSTDERELLIERFLDAGATTGETTFHITAEAANTKVLAEKYPSNFYLFVCNPQAGAMIQDLRNVFKLKGVENLTDIDIALTRAFRTLNPSAVGVKRICIEIVSDALLQHHAVTTRRWLSALLPTLKSKGFTTLAVFDPHMHLPEEVQAILGLFDGEIRVSEKETPEGIKHTLRIRKLINQKYQENEVTLTKESLSD